MRNDTVRRIAALATFGLAMGSGGVLLGQSRHRALPPVLASPAPDSELFAPDAGTPVFVLLPASSASSSASGPRCDGTSCRLSTPAESARQCEDITFIDDNGTSFVVDRSTLGTTTCNATCSECVITFTDGSFDVSGERVDRVARDVRQGRMHRIEACTVACDDDGGSMGEAFAVAHVKGIAPAYSFDEKGNLVTEDSKN